MTTVTAAPVGPLLQGWRHRRRRSQMDLALSVGVSTRHLSFVETGRSRPSPELVLALAEHLEVPLRERNSLLLAAGFAPRYGQTPLDDVAMARVRGALQELLDRHDPYPGVVVDRVWDIVLANRAAAQLTAAVPAELAGPPANVFRLCLHPNGLAPQTLNFAEWAGYLLGQLRKVQAASGDPRAGDLVAEVESYPTVASLDTTATRVGHEPVLLVPWELRIADDRLSFFTTLTTFGTPRDVTLDELAVELFYPADDATEAFLRATAVPPLPA